MTLQARELLDFDVNTLDTLYRTIRAFSVVATILADILAIVSKGKGKGKRGFI